MILSFKEQFIPLIESGQKIHTIREDKSKRWIPGRKIHFWKGNPRNVKQNPYPLQNPPVEYCISTEEIGIIHYTGMVRVFIDKYEFGRVYHHGLDDIYEVTDDLVELAKNDGFDTIEEFLQWFNENFTGRIIHWTDKIYFNHEEDDDLPF